MHQEFTEFEIFDETTSISTKNDRISATGIHGQQDYHFSCPLSGPRLTLGRFGAVDPWLAIYLVTVDGSQLLVHAEISKFFKLKIPIILKK